MPHNLPPPSAASLSPFEARVTVDSECDLLHALVAALQISFMISRVGRALMLSLIPNCLTSDCTSSPKTAAKAAVLCGFATSVIEKHNQSHGFGHRLDWDVITYNEAPVVHLSQRISIYQGFDKSAPYGFKNNADRNGKSYTLRNVRSSTKWGLHVIAPSDMSSRKN